MRVKDTWDESEISREEMNVFNYFWVNKSHRWHYMSMTDLIWTAQWQEDGYKSLTLCFNWRANYKRESKTMHSTNDQHRSCDTTSVNQRVFVWLSERYLPVGPAQLDLVHSPELMDVLRQTIPNLLQVRRHPDLTHKHTTIRDCRVGQHSTLWGTCHVNSF